MQHLERPKMCAVKFARQATGGKVLEGRGLTWWVGISTVRSTAELEVARGVCQAHTDGREERPQSWRGRRQRAALGCVRNE